MFSAEIRLWEVEGNQAGPKLDGMDGFSGDHTTSETEVNQIGERRTGVQLLHEVARL